MKGRFEFARGEVGANVQSSREGGSRFRKSRVRVGANLTTENAREVLP